MDSARISLYKKQVRIIGERVCANDDSVEVIGIGADSLSWVLAKTLGSLVTYRPPIKLIDESCQIGCKCVPTAFVAQELLPMMPMIKHETAEQGLG